MNLQENIYRIKEVMGMAQKKLDGSETITLNENTSESILNKMIDELGLYNTIRMVGSYEDLLNHINPEDISESDKIKFIRDVVTSKGPEISGRESISIYDLGVKPIWYDEYKNNIRVITTMYKNGVKVNVYINEIYDDSGMILYSHMPEDAIDRVFKVLTDVLDNKKEGMTEEMVESEPKVGTGKKPEGSDRRLYTDENPKDTVSVKFKTKQDIIDTLSKESFKSKSHARQSQIINLIHQRLRVALERAKDPEVKKRLRTAFEYIKSKKEQSKNKTQEMKEGLHDASWENDEGDKISVVKKDEFENKYGELITLILTDEGRILFKHSDYGNEFIPLEKVITHLPDGGRRFNIVLHNQEKEFVDNFINSINDFNHLREQEQNESIVSSTIKRSANRRTLEKYITDGEINYPMLCDDFEDGYEYADAVIDYAIDELLSELDDDIYERDYYSDVMDYLRNFCRNEFGQYLIDIYERTCTEEELDEQQNESEITERCWKGYTQKGMKTMFGKRYPNCVKVKK